MNIWTRMMAVFLLASVLLTACSSSPDEEQKVLTPPTSDTTEMGQTLTVVPTETAKKNTEDSDQYYQIQTRLTDFHLLTQTKGLAWGLTRNALRMYLTKDSGKTWVNISPASNVQFSENLKYGKNIFFKDQLNGWVIRDSEGSNEAIVLHTTDGGESWEMSSIPENRKVTGIFFITPQRGWIMTTADSSTGREEKVMYRTEDGGARWKVVMQNASYNPIDQQAEQVIPQMGFTMGISFTDPTHGFVAVQDLGEPKLYRTIDGGNNWKKAPKFFDRDKMSGCGSVMIGSPIFFNSDRKQGWMSIGCRQGNHNTKFNGYFTTDAGQTWTFAPFAINSNEGVNQMLPPSFISIKEGWFLYGNELYHTVDQGKTWTPLPVSTVLSNNLEKYPEVVKLQFTSPKVGWMLIEKSDDKRSLLMQTVDGGITWKGL